MRSASGGVPSAMTDRQPDLAAAPPDGLAPRQSVRTLLGRITRVELTIAALVAVAMVVLVIVEPAILEAPFENARTLLFTVGGTLIALIALIVMLRFSVPAAVRVVVLVVPFAVMNFWLISPYFRNEVVDEDFAVSIAEQAPGDPTAGAGAADVPVLLGSGRFVGLAGHSGSGDAGLFRDVDGSLVLRFENFDIDNGPALKVYLVPGADQTSLPEGSIALGDLKGNVGDQNYVLPTADLGPGAYTALVWCEAFGVEFVGATVVI